MTKTKIIATIGPASSAPERLAEILDAGADVCRLNFSHGTLEQHSKTLALIRKLSAERKLPVAVLGDLCGPKIRLNDVRGGSFQLATGSEIRFVRGGAECTPQALTTSYARLHDDLKVGDRLLIDDGLVRLLITDRRGDEFVASCTVGGMILPRKGVNLPDSHLDTPALTDKDRRDLDWAIANGVDYVALSFVRRPSDLFALKEIIDQRRASIGVIVKVEKFEALEHLDELVANCDGIMVARGDLGVEMDVWRVPLVQKAITGRCREQGVPVIIATQMLQSMVTNPTPTRAEVSDVANAILDYVDAIMLSAETASGQFPAQAVEMMQKLAEVTEAYSSQPYPLTPAKAAPSTSREASAIAHAAVQAARDLNARLVAVWTTTGATVRMVAQHRLPMPVVGVTDDERVWRRMNLLFGVMPLRVEPISNPALMTEVLDQRLREARLVNSGDLIVVVTSTQPTISGQTDTTLVHRIA